MKAFGVYLPRGQGHLAYLLRSISRPANHLKYFIDHIDPYTLIGDVGSTQKTYRNIKKLLDLVGIKYTELGTKSESSQIWNQFVEKSEKEKEITKKWLGVVENNLV